MNNEEPCYYASEAANAVMILKRMSHVAFKGGPDWTGVKVQSNNEPPDDLQTCCLKSILAALAPGHKINGFEVIEASVMRSTLGIIISDELKVHKNATDTLRRFLLDVVSVAAKESFIANGGLQALVSAMKANVDDIRLQVNGCAIF
jgi:hypothetical protein